MNKNNILWAVVFLLGFFLVTSFYKKYSIQEQDPTLVPISPPVDILPEAPPPPIKQTLDEALKTITKEELSNTVKYLASDELEGRMSGKAGNIKAFEWMKKELEKSVPNVKYQEFPIQGGVNPGPKKERGDNFSKNLISWFPGNELKDEIIVIGAHGDHIGWGSSYSRAPGKVAIHPGADDNASGSAVALEIAQALAGLKTQLRRTWSVQIYSGEEMGLVGSAFYVRNPILPEGNPSIKNHVFMINMDMVGYLQNRDQNRVSLFTGVSSSPDIDASINKLQGKYGFASRITGRRGGGSDHANFLRFGVPIAMIHTGLHAYYHTPSDTADKLNYDGMEAIGRYVLELAWAVDNSDKKPVFNGEVLRDIPLDKDHDYMNFENVTQDFPTENLEQSVPVETIQTEE